MRLSLAAALVTAAAVTGVAAAQEEEMPTRDCRGRIESGRGPLVFNWVKALVVGPLSFSGRATGRRRHVGSEARAVCA